MASQTPNTDTNEAVRDHDWTHGATHVHDTQGECPASSSTTPSSGQTQSAGQQQDTTSVFRYEINVDEVSPDDDSGPENEPSQKKQQKHRKKRGERMEYKRSPLSQEMEQPSDPLAPPEFREPRNRAGDTGEEDKEGSWLNLCCK